MRRTTMSLALTAVAALALPAAANATVSQDFSLSAKPGKASTSKKKVPVTLNFSTGTKDDSGAQPPTTAAAAVYFPAGSVYNGNLFPACKAATINDAKSTDDCPAKSIVGSGKAAGLAPGPITQNDLKITVTVGGPDRVNLWVEGTSPLRIQSNLDSKLTKVSGGAYGLKLSVDIPANLEEPAPGVPVAITLFQVKVGATIVKNGVKRGLIEVNKCSGTWKSQGEFQYVNNPTIKVQDSQPCTKG